jgi:hypothetical protein
VGFGVKVGVAAGGGVAAAGADSTLGAAPVDAWPGPAPTNVGHAPHASNTVRGTVTATPGWTRCTTKFVLTVPGASVWVKLPGLPTTLPASTSPLLAVPNCNE